MRDLFQPAAPARRDTTTGADDDARRRAAKAATVPLFGASPTPIQALVRKTAQVAADAERATRERITARRSAPTLLDRKRALPPSIAAKTDGAFGVSIPAAELLARVVAHWMAHREPVLISPSSLAAATGCEEEAARHQIGELQATGLILPVTDAMGRAGWRPEPGLLR